MIWEDGEVFVRVNLEHIDAAHNTFQSRVVDLIVLGLQVIARLRFKERVIGRVSPVGEASRTRLLSRVHPPTMLLLLTADSDYQMSFS